MKAVCLVLIVGFALRLSAQETHVRGYFEFTNEQTHIAVKTSSIQTVIQRPNDTIEVTTLTHFIRVKPMLGKFDPKGAADLNLTRAAYDALRRTMNDDALPFSREWLTEMEDKSRPVLLRESALTLLMISNGLITCQTLEFVRLTDPQNAAKVSP